MTIEPVKRVTVLAFKSLEDEVVETLRRLGTVEIERVERDDIVTPKILSDDEAQALRRYNFSVVQIDFILNFLRENVGERPGFLKSMIKDKYEMTIDEFLNSAHRIDLDKLYAECSEHQRRLIAFRDRIAAFEQERKELEHWTELEAPMEELVGDALVGLMLVRIAAIDLEPLLGALEEEAPESSVEIVGGVPPWSSCIVLYHSDVEEGVRSVVSRYRCEIVQLPSLPDEPHERLEQVLREITAIDRRQAYLKEVIGKYLEHVPALEVLKEYYANERDRVDLKASFGETVRTVTIQGWVAERYVERTIDRLTEYEELSVEIEDPGENDNPPVALKNPTWIQPFELLVRLYGSPNRLEYDPTFIVAISFMIFFGFCLGDVGYGVVLIPTFLLMRKYLPLGRNAKDLLTALTYGAGCAIIIGVLSGSWFGIEIEKLPEAFQSVAYLDGLNKTVAAMGVAIMLGLIHMLTGTGIEFRDNWVGGNKLDAMIDQGLIFFLFIGGGASLALSASGIIPSAVPTLIVMISILSMILLLGRGAKSIPGKIASGLFETYGTVVGYISDAISYVRLFALGLSTVIIALVVNNIAGLVGGTAPVFGVILMILILVVGHTFNIAINLLGAFVHPLRLEFVEFFGKFYDDGGKELRPFSVKSGTVIIKDEG